MIKRILKCFAGLSVLGISMFCILVAGGIFLAPRARENPVQVPIAYFTGNSVQARFVIPRNASSVRVRITAGNIPTKSTSFNGNFILLTNEVQIVNKKINLIMDYGKKTIGNEKYSFILDAVAGNDWDSILVADQIYEVRFECDHVFTKATLLVDYFVHNSKYEYPIRVRDWGLLIRY